VLLLQKPLAPVAPAEAYPENLTSSDPAQESFQGISGM
jgi:hypothetical protein